MADLDTIQITSEQRHAERVAAADKGFGLPEFVPTRPYDPAFPDATPFDATNARVRNPDGTLADPVLEPVSVNAIHKRLKQGGKAHASTVDGHTYNDADKAIEHLMSLIRYVMNSDGEIPRCTEATRTYLRQHLDF